VLESGFGSQAMLSSEWEELGLPDDGRFNGRPLKEIFHLFSNSDILSFWWAQGEYIRLVEAFCMSSHNRLGNKTLTSFLDDGLLQMVLFYLPKPTLESSLLSELSCALKHHGHPTRCLFFAL